MRPRQGREPKKGSSDENRAVRNDFVVELKGLIVVPC